MGQAKLAATRTLANNKPFMSAEYAKENKQNKLTALQVTHTEWINRCILVHNYKSGTMVNLDKTELLEEIMNQLYRGAVNLTEHDKYLLECNLTDLATTNGERNIGCSPSR